MLLQSCLIAVAVLAGLSTLILLRSKYEKPCSGNYRPRDETRPDDSILEAVMPEIEDADGLHVLAAAFCCVAAATHGTNPAHQEQLASAFYDLCCTGFKGVKLDPAVKAFVDGMMLKAKKK